MSATNNREGARGKSHGFPKTIANLFSTSSSSSSSHSKPTITCKSHLSSMLKMLNVKLHRLCSRLRWPIRRRAKARVVLRRFGHHPKSKEDSNTNERVVASESMRPIRVATFNAAMFSMAPAVPWAERSPLVDSVERDIRGKQANDRPKSILKQQTLSKSKLRVSINLPEDEISLERNRHLSSSKEDEKGKAPMIRSSSLPGNYYEERERERTRSNRSVLDVLREVEADVLALQNVKAEEEKGMRPLSDLAEGLGMKYVFAESWAPEYGNAILSKWPIKHWRVQKIFDDTDFRNVLKATIDIPKAGELNFHCTHLDHLDENWRMKQISAILRSNDGPHILVGGLNSLDETDYSAERWTDIVKYYEEIGKPTPKVEVMKFLKAKQYTDAKNFAGECEAVVVVAKGQDVQGTCKYGTRVDYILASPNSPYKFMPSSYGVVSAKGTSDHHIVKVDIVIAKTNESDSRHRQPKQRVVKMDKAFSKAIWKTHS